MRRSFPAHFRVRSGPVQLRTEYETKGNFVPVNGTKTASFARKLRLSRICEAPWPPVSATPMAARALRERASIRNMRALGARIGL